MKKIFVIFIIFILFSCTNNITVQPPPQPPEVQEFTGITRTFEDCRIISVDSEDWKPSPIIVNKKLDSQYVVYSKPACPNPFSNYVDINFSLSVDAFCTITFYDKPGHVLKKYAKGVFQGGQYTYTISKDSLFTHTGIYRVVISAWSLDSSKHNETFGDIDYEIR